MKDTEIPENAVEQLKDFDALCADIVSNIEAMRQYPAPAWLEEVGYAYERVIVSMERVEEENIPGESYCGMASSMMLDNPLRDFSVAIMTAAPKNGTFHHFNLVSRKSAVALCDMTASQFLTKPMLLLGSLPYFVGSVEQFKEIITIARDNSWKVIRETFPHENFRNLWDVDLKRSQDYEFAVQLGQAFKKSPLCCLVTESLHYAWESTWGDQMRIWRADNSLTTAFLKAAKPGLVTENQIAPIEKMVNWSNYKTLTLEDAP